MDDQGPTRQRGNLTGATGAGQPGGRLVVVADHRGIQVAIAVDLRASEEADIDQAALQVILEDFGHRADAQSSGHQCRVADRGRQALGLRADGARFINQHQVGAPSAPRQVDGHVGNANAHEDDFGIAQHARCAGDHDLVGAEVAAHG